MNTKLTAVYGCAFVRPEVTATITVHEPSWLEKLQGSLQGSLYTFWYDIKTAGYFAISVVCFKYALLGHF
jgi:hypothetical protein